MRRPYRFPEGNVRGDVANRFLHGAPTGGICHAGHVVAVFILGSDLVHLHARHHFVGAIAAHLLGQDVRYLKPRNGKAGNRRIERVA